MTRVTLVTSPYGPDGTIKDPVTGTVVRVGQTVDVDADVAARLESTRALGNEIDVDDGSTTLEPDIEPDAKENADPAPPAAPTPTAPTVAQEAAS